MKLLVSVLHCLFSVLPKCWVEDYTYSQNIVCILTLSCQTIMRAIRLNTYFFAGLETKDFHFLSVNLQDNLSVANNCIGIFYLDFAFVFASFS